MPRTYADWTQANGLAALQLLAHHIHTPQQLSALLGGIPRNTVRRWLAGAHIPQDTLIHIFLLAERTAEQTRRYLRLLGFANADWRMV